MTTPLRRRRPPARRFAQKLRIAVVALALAALAAFGFTPARAATNFPALTGRVVDQAQVLSAGKRADLEGKLADLETKSGIQLEVATIASLDGEEIEPLPIRKRQMTQPACASKAYKVPSSEVK